MAYIRMASLNIEDVDTSGSKGPSEIDESMKVNAFILVILSSNNALRSKSRKMVDNRERVEFSALRIGEQGIA